MVRSAAEMGEVEGGERFVKERMVANPQTMLSLTSEQMDSIEKGHFGVMPGVLLMDRGIAYLTQNQETSSVLKQGTCLSLKIDKTLLLQETALEAFIPDLNKNSLFYVSPSGTDFAQLNLAQGDVEDEYDLPSVEGERVRVSSDPKKLPRHKEDWNLVNEDQSWEKSGGIENNGDMAYLNAEFKLTDKHETFLNQFSHPEIGLCEIISQNGVTAILTGGMGAMFNSVNTTYLVDQKDLPDLSSGLTLDVGVLVEKKGKRGLAYTLTVRDQDQKLLLSFEVEATLMPQKVLDGVLKKLKSQVEATIK